MKRRSLATLETPVDRRQVSEGSRMPDAVGPDGEPRRAGAMRPTAVVPGM